MHSRNHQLETIADLKWVHQLSSGDLARLFEEISDKTLRLLEAVAAADARQAAERAHLGLAESVAASPTMER